MIQLSGMIEPISLAVGDTFDIADGMPSDALFTAGAALPRDRSLFMFHHGLSGFKRREPFRKAQATS